MCISKIIPLVELEVQFACFPLEEALVPLLHVEVNRDFRREMCNVANVALVLL